MKTEVEVKIKLHEPVQGFKRRLSGLGAELSEARYFEDNMLLDTPERTLEKKGELLRLRLMGDKGLITFKGPQAREARYKIRREIETLVAHPHALMSIFEQLGFIVTFRYQKYRETHRLDLCRVEIDETPVGNYIELEGPPDQIDQKASALGFSEGDYILKNYADIFSEECSRTGRDPSSGMVFEQAKGVPG